MLLPQGRSFVYFLLSEVSQKSKTLLFLGNRQRYALGGVGEPSLISDSYVNYVANRRGCLFLGLASMKYWIKIFQRKLTSTN